MHSQSVRTAVVPAAGLGTRFLPFSKAVPKELAPLVTTPTIEFVVTEAADNGIERLLVVVSPGKQALADYFAPRPDLEQALTDKGDIESLESVRRAAALLEVAFAEQGEPRGLGDAVARAERFCAGRPFAVLLPDDLIDERDDLLADMLTVHAEHGGVVLGLIDVGREAISAYGCVAPVAGDDGDVVAVADLVEKPAAADAPSTLAMIGRYVLPPEIFDALRETPPGSGGEIQLTDGIRRLVAQGVPAHGVVFRGRRYDTGNRLEYVKAIVQLAERHPQIGEEFGAWLRGHVGAEGGRG
ncbi:MAG: UTP--glucose-1-phosphate uridylyltransferase [Jatrophihabitans sp.]|nr:MAG: UTP--glucose-1-phosphate uridylyltransferase [Jatrophihabitans sp.]